MKICLLGSGSKGNCCYIEHEDQAILIDQGFSLRSLRERLFSRGLDERKIKGILVSHEHADHIKGVGVAARKIEVPVFGTRQTIENASLGCREEEELIVIGNDRPFQAGIFRITPFKISHDAADPVQFSIRAGGRKVSLVTDLGVVTRGVRENLGDSNLVVIESNHDEEMLDDGPYPAWLKQRIKGGRGHLSNTEAAVHLLDAARNGFLTGIILAHVSQENNTYSLAEKTVRELLRRNGKQVGFLAVARQDSATEVVEV